jgi:hypothetical protein
MEEIRGAEITTTSARDKPLLSPHTPKDNLIHRQWADQMRLERNLALLLTAEEDIATALSA